MAAASSFYDSGRVQEGLALNFPVNKQHYQRANHRHDKATEVKPVHSAKAEEGTNPSPNDCTDDTKNNGNDEPTAVFPRHNPFG